MKLHFWEDASMKRITLFLALVLAAALGWAQPAAAVDLPCRAVKLIIPWAAGGDTDVIMRKFALDAQKHLGKPIVVQNVGGQGGNKGAKVAKDARADGCTLFSGHDSMITSWLQGQVEFHYDAFEPLALLTSTPSVIGANPKAPWKNAKELVEYAKKNPDKALVGATLGSTSHFFPVMVESASGAKFKYVSYEGTAPRMRALLGGHIQLAEINITVAKKNLELGKLKALGIAAPKRAPQLPDIPTLKEQGINVVYGVNRGWFVPKGTPKAVKETLIAALAKAAKNEALVKDLYDHGTDVDFRPGAEYAKFLDAQLAEMTDIAKKVGLYKVKK
jgi:tripartite-type tricarboxylate transporter receptor subunit TctC